MLTYVVFDVDLLVDGRLALLVVVQPGETLGGTVHFLDSGQLPLDLETIAWLESAWQARNVVFGGKGGADNADTTGTQRLLADCGQRGNSRVNMGVNEDRQALQEIFL